jgi:hypothetical protein
MGTLLRSSAPPSLLPIAPADQRLPGQVGGQRELAGSEEGQSGVESHAPKVVHH